MGLLSKMPAFASGATWWPWTEETDETIYDPSIAWPKISIVTPSYNQGGFIEETIRSVVLQNYPNLEYIIIDGRSSDNTTEIIKKYQRWISYWVSEPDRGQSHAINKGFERCTGEIFNWINSDDWYLKETFFEVASSFLKNRSAKVVSGSENHISLTGEITQFAGTFVERTLASSIELSYISQPSTFFRLTSFKQLGPLVESLHYSMDAELWIRFLLMFGTKPFLKIKKALVNFRFHSNSKTVNNLVNNSLALNFLVEKSSITVHLLKTVEVPEKISKFWTAEVLKTPEVYDVDCHWQFNENLISRKELRLYFIKRYINIQFQKRNFKQAYWGITQLVKNNGIDFFVIKSVMKLFAKKFAH
jgi:glycosyltransferase involved in cell wall biosynthesis